MMSLRKGSKVWVEDRDSAWVAAEVTDFIGKQVQVLTEFKKKVLILPDKLFLRDEESDHGGVDDMTKLTYLNEPGVLDNLKRRYALNEIYTYTGSILIAVNPFTKLPHLYNVHMMEQYKGAPFGELSPHVFAVADASYRAMISESQSQSILVSGESGAGKTETTKLIMQYLTYVGGRAASDDRTVEQQVLELLVLLAQGTVDTIKCHLNALDSGDGFDAVFINAILSGVQQRNLEKAWGKPGLDRVSLIIEIFNAHAQTKEGKLQAELAALMYKRSRLVRVRGPGGRNTFDGEAEVVSARGKGSGGRGFISGAGETELQLQRRRNLHTMIRQDVELSEEQLEEVQFEALDYIEQNM